MKYSFQNCQKRFFYSHLLDLLLKVLIVFVESVQVHLMYIMFIMYIMYIKGKYQNEWNALPQHIQVLRYVRPTPSFQELSSSTFQSLWVRLVTPNQNFTFWWIVYKRVGRLAEWPYDLYWLSTTKYQPVLFYTDQENNFVTP